MKTILVASLGVLACLWAPVAYAEGLDSPPQTQILLEGSGLLQFGGIESQRLLMNTANPRLEIADTNRVGWMLGGGLAFRTTAYEFSPMSLGIGARVHYNEGWSGRATKDVASNVTRSLEEREFAWLGELEAVVRFEQLRNAGLYPFAGVTLGAQQNRAKIEMIDQVYGQEARHQIETMAWNPVAGLTAGIDWIPAPGFFIGLGLNFRASLGAPYDAVHTIFYQNGHETLATATTPETAIPKAGDILHYSDGTEVFTPWGQLQAVLRVGLAF